LNKKSTMTNSLKFSIIFITIYLLIGFGNQRNAWANSNLEIVLSVQPDYILLVNDEVFSVNIMITGVENLFAVAFDVVYNPNLIIFNSITEGDFLNENGQAQTFFLHSLQPGKIIVAISRTDTNEPGVSSDNDTLLAKLYFTAVHHGQAELRLENTGLMKPDLNIIPHTKQNGNLRIIAPPKILQIPDVTLEHGDTIQVYLNNFAEDADTPIEQLNWQVLDGPYLDFILDNENKTLSFWKNTRSEQTYLKLKVSDPDGLSDTTSFNVVMPAGIGDNISMQPMIKVYPNPFSEKITIESNLIDDSLRILKIKITNANGVQVIKDWHLEKYNSNLQLDVSDLIPGLYILSIQKNKITYSMPIIKKYTD